MYGKKKASKKPMKGKTPMGFKPKPKKKKK